jgi:hypothetical protein
MSRGSLTDSLSLCIDTVRKLHGPGASNVHDQEQLSDAVTEGRSKPMVHFNGNFRRPGGE